MALEYPQPPLTDGVVLLRPWQERDLALVEEASRDDYVALIEHMPVPFREEAGRAWIKLRHGHAAGDRGWTFAMVEIRSGTASGGVSIT